jgi:hypothetical protein
MFRQPLNAHLFCNNNNSVCFKCKYFIREKAGAGKIFYTKEKINEKKEIDEILKT